MIEPIFLIEGHDVTMYSSVSAVTTRVEQIDVLNKVYTAFDRMGLKLQFEVQEPYTRRIGGILHTHAFLAIHVGPLTKVLAKGMENLPMDLETRYGGEAPAPKAATFEEAFAYFINEERRRSYNSANGLTDDELNHDPGMNSWSIGEILAHQLYLLRFMAETLEPGSTADRLAAAIGEVGAWNLEAIIAEREELWDVLDATFKRMTPEGFMEKRPDLPPDWWREWPVLMRFMRPHIDYATHIGQVNYARRQLGNPVTRV